MLGTKSGSVRGSNLSFVLASISKKSEISLLSASPGKEISKLPFRI